MSILRKFWNDICDTRDAIREYMKKIAAERKFRRHVEWLHDQSDHFNKYVR